ncbi:WD40-repeat-containing domain protein [Xylariales sp. AK1849]|nr:WD40-repeat-containing domain protein [Xylariales sp. AK1849]
MYREPGFGRNGKQALFSTRRAVWSVGGTAPGGTGVDTGRGRLLGNGNNAPLYSTSFSSTRPKSEEEQEKHTGRLASALDIDRIRRVIDHDGRSTFPRCKGGTKDKSHSISASKTTWTGTEWSNDLRHQPKHSKQQRMLPNAPFKVLDAPGLRDDFYCSTLAFSPTCNTLAVGLGNLLYGWSETTGVSMLHPGVKDRSWLTSVAFSSNEGCKSILAFGRSSGSLVLLSLFDSLLPRFEAQHPNPVACLSWRPVVTIRPSLNPNNPGVNVRTEDLLVGEEEVARDNWPGAMTLLARVKVHTQQICGFSWSPDGRQFVTGRNDNLCCLFNVDEHHLAAVKAIAFCPWQPHLLATGGGSNDKMIHFFHTTSGAALATISVSAQVTSLLWSTTRREIAATFGYAQPDHPVRIAVFSWPDCQMVGSVTWDNGDHRALFAVAYPGPPSVASSNDGCIIVAGSDESVKFHEVWGVKRGKTVVGLGPGVLGGSDIIEMSEGIDKEGDVIR